MRKICVHIIIRDKFTSGYINFLKRFNLGWDHFFFTFDKNYILNLINNDNVYIVKDYGTIFSDYTDLLNKADRIILAAFFDEALELLNMPKNFWNKTYIQFWGGDIYRFRQKRDGLLNLVKQKAAKKMVSNCIGKCAGVLTLVEKDYEAIEDIFSVKNKYHRVIQVPDDFYEINHLNYEKITKEENYHGKKRILVGNSATEENQHIEIFELLKDKINDNIEVLVPLSYGVNAYKEYVLSKGKEILKDAFVPIVEFMPREKYIGLLSTCDVAIFNNNRQQATGNIIVLANLGKKIYLRDDTSMWDFFKELNFKIHTINELKTSSIIEILDNPDEETNNNYLALKQMEDEAIKQWEDFFI